ncbi:hypothetical protein B0H11DRAFT_1955178 [Mycena galericulata]|nr:hypothetical protein B0H11DRAFT_1955178 [Mycena galericulata]
MGPKPMKKLKLKEYNLPRNHQFLFIKRPWPFNDSMSTARNQQAYCNGVVGWLCCMIEDLCRIEISSTQIVIFWQSTHQDVIADIELLPSDDTPEPSLDAVLGAHHSAQFLTPEHVGDGNAISSIYYYDYLHKNSPAKTNWTDATASYKTLPKGFAIKHGGMWRPAYPKPSPTERGRLPLTRTLPGRLIYGHPDCAPPLTEPEPVPANDEANIIVPQEESAESFVRSPSRRPQSSPGSRSPSCPPPRPETRSPSPPEPTAPSEFALTPYERPLHFPRGHTVGAVESHSPFPAFKRDPHEEEEAAVERLRDVHSVKQEKLEESVKTEDQEDRYTPSAQLLETFKLVQAKASSSSHMSHAKPIKREPGIKLEPESGDQVPPDLRDNFDRVQRELWGDGERERRVKREEPKHGVPVKVEHHPVPLRAKPEPVDTPMPPPPPLDTRLDPFAGFEPGVSVKREVKEEFNSRLPPIINAHPPSAYPHTPDPRVKREEFAPSLRRASSNTHSPGIKREDLEDGRRYASRGAYLDPCP